MKIHDVEQGSPDWLRLRSGIPTASDFDKIFTPGGKESKSAEPYMLALIAERLMGHPRRQVMSEWMARGKTMEASAVSLYEFKHDIDTVTVGFITNDAGTVGASPDRLVGDVGLLEAKCPAEHTHIGYLLKKPVDAAYYPQVQGQLWIAEREWLDIISFHPELPDAEVRVWRDEKYIEKLSAIVTAFSGALEKQFAMLMESATEEVFG